MEHLKTVLSVLGFCLLFGVATSSHFRGGTLSCSPAGSFKVKCDFGMGWRRSSQLSYCPRNGSVLLSVGSFTISTYTSSHNARAYINVTDCSDKEDWLYGKGQFYFSYWYGYGYQQVRSWYSGCCWVPYGSWKLMTETNLTSTGIINHSPKTSADHLVRLRRYCSETIRIPVTDQDGDIVRCRWATSYESSSAANQFRSYATLDSENCTLTYHGNANRTGLIPVALSIEDFGSSWSAAKSVVPLQFFVEIITSSSCSFKPLLTGKSPKDGSCIDIPPSTTMRISVEAIHEANAKSISEIVVYGAPVGLSKSSLRSYVGVGGKRTYYQVLSWKPQSYQYSTPVQLCFKPLDNTGVEGEKRCTTLRPGSNDTPRPVPYSFYSSVVSTNEAIFYLKFDHQCKFTSKTPGKIVWYLGGKRIFVIQPSKSPFCKITSGSQLSCRIPRAVVGTSGDYKVELEEGVVGGIGCDGGGPPSPSTVIWNGYRGGSCSSGFKLVKNGYYTYCEDIDECAGRNDTSGPTPAISPSPVATQQHIKSSSATACDFKCWYYPYSCLPSYKVCNGYHDCYYGEDEYYCSSPVPSIQPSSSVYSTFSTPVPAIQSSAHPYQYTQQYPISPTPTRSAAVIPTTSIRVPDFELDMTADCDGRCINTRGSYSCECDQGYNLSQDKTACVDIDECSSGNGGCSHVCVNTLGSYHCACPNNAFTMQSDKKTCTVNFLQVTCTAHDMRVEFERELAFGLQNRHLHLNDPACTATGNSSHLSIRTSHGECQTTHTETSTHITYSNRVRNSPSGDHGTITRDPEINIEFHCKYLKTGQVTGKQLQPLQRSVSVQSSGYGEFTFVMDLYHSDKYEDAYTAESYPLKKKVRDELYVQIKVVSSDSHDLVVFPETCKATTTTSPDSSPQYTFLENGCTKDSTMWYYYDIKSSQQMQIKMFSFADRDFHYIYLHCKVTVCHRDTENSRCRKGCLPTVRKRRASEQEEEAPEVELSSGKIYLDKDSASGTAANTDAATLTGVTAGMATVGAVLMVAVGALLYHRQMLLRRLRIMPESQISGSHKAEEGATESLEMENGGSERDVQDASLLNNDWLGSSASGDAVVTSNACNAELPPVVI